MKENNNSLFSKQTQKAEDTLKKVKEATYNPQEHKDKTRSEIALYFVKGYFAIVVFVFVFTFIYNAVFQAQAIDLIQIFTTVSGALSGLLGFVLGYYFKSEEEKD